MVRRFELSRGQWGSIMSFTKRKNWATIGVIAMVMMIANVAMAAGTGRFYISGGQIIDPDGNVFIAKGINLGDPSPATQLTKLFPGINFIRYADGGFPSPASLQAFVTQISAQKIVVEIEDHPWPL